MLYDPRIKKSEAARRRIEKELPKLMMGESLIFELMDHHYWLLVRSVAMDMGLSAVRRGPHYLVVSLQQTE